MTTRGIFTLKRVIAMAVALLLMLSVPVFPGTTKAQAAGEKTAVKLSKKELTFKSSGGKKTIKIENVDPENIKKIKIQNNSSNDKHAYFSIDVDKENGVLIISAKENKAINQSIKLPFIITISLKKKNFKNRNYQKREWDCPLSIEIKGRKSSGIINDMIITDVDETRSRFCALDAKNPCRTNTRYNPLTNYEFTKGSVPDCDYILGRTVSIEYNKNNPTSFSVSKSTKAVYGAFRADSDSPGMGKYLEDMITGKHYLVNNGSSKSWPTLAVNRGQESVPIMRGGVKGNKTTAFDIAGKIGTEGVVYAKLELNSNDKINTITYIPSWDGAVIAGKVDGTAAYSGTTKTDLKGYAIVHDGRTVGISGIAEGDIVFFNTKGKFAEVYSENKATGAITAVGNESFTVGGKDYPFEMLRYVKEGAGLVSADRTYLEELSTSGAEVTIYKDRMDRPVIIVADAVKTETKTLILSSPAIPANSLNGSFKLTGFETEGSATVSYEVDPTALSSVSEPITDPAAQFLAGELVTLTVKRSGTVTELSFTDAVGYSGKEAFSSSLVSDAFPGSVKVYKVKVPSGTAGWPEISAGGANAPTGITEITTLNKFTGVISAEDAAGRGLVRIYQKDGVTSEVVVFDTGSNIGYVSPDPISLEGIGGNTNNEYDVVTVFVTAAVTAGTRVTSMSVLAADDKYTALYTDVASGTRYEGDGGYFCRLKISKDGKKILGNADEANETVFFGSIMPGDGGGIAVLEADLNLDEVVVKNSYLFAEKPLIIADSGEAGENRYTKIASGALGEYLYSPSDGYYIVGSDENRRITCMAIRTGNAAKEDMNGILLGYSDLLCNYLSNNGTTTQEAIDTKWQTLEGFYAEKAKIDAMLMIADVYNHSSQSIPAGKLTNADAYIYSRACYDDVLNNCRNVTNDSGCLWLDPEMGTGINFVGITSIANDDILEKIRSVISYNYILDSTPNSHCVGLGEVNHESSSGGANHRYYRNVWIRLNPDIASLAGIENPIISGQYYQDREISADATEYRWDQI